MGHWYNDKHYPKESSAYTIIGDNVIKVKDLINGKITYQQEQGDSKMFDLTNVEASNDFEPIPSGEYPACISKLEWKTSKAGAKYLNIGFKVTGEKYTNRVIFNSLNLYHPKENVKNIAMQELKKILMASGCAADKLNFKDDEALLLVLSQVVLTVNVIVRQESDYPAKNVIRGYKPLAVSINTANNPNITATEIPF